MASSSSAIESYDVFLSFRGEDTRYNFTSHLYDALCRNNIKAFIDYRIHRGDEITPALERVIEGAKISIIVFSEHYTDSTFCLDELVRITECKESKAQIVLPIFYKVDPSEVTYQEAFARHETNTNGMKDVERWKLAFCKVLEVAGWHIVKNSDEAEIIRKITNEVSEKLNNSLPKGEELMHSSMVGQTAQDNFNKIWECLMSDKITRVGVYGMGGVGKTTIAIRINDQLLATVNSFSRVFWVTVSKDLSIFNIQNNIGKMINLDLSSEDDALKRAAMLRKRLKTEKFVLILDDVWEHFEIEDVGIPPLVGGNKLLLTSRSRRVCEIMKCQSILVKPLSELEALDLFIKESEQQIDDSLEWRDIMSSVVKECVGLPLAIIVVARRMRGVVEFWKWRDTLRDLQNPCKGENPEMEEKVFKVLKFSYDRLSNDRCRQCFLYCSLFPEDQELETKDLIEYWIGSGLIDEVDRQGELDKGYVILDELIYSSLLTYNSFGFIKMHDVIRDMARINVEVGLQFEDPLESIQVVNTTMLKRFLNIAPHCSKLKTLVLQCHFEKNLPGCFFTNMQGLNVLHISSMSGLRSIPDSITNLRNLRLLIIYNCSDLQCIPSLVGLEKLRHLNISWNKSLKEMANGIERLVNLRVLYISLNNYLRGSIPNGIVKTFSHLQILDLKGTRVEVEPEALSSLEEVKVVRVHFFNLQKLNCYLKSGHWRRLHDYQINYGNYHPGYLKKGMCFEAIRDVDEWTGEYGIFLPDDIQNLQLVDWESPMFYVLNNSTFVHLQTIRIFRFKGRYLFMVELAQQLLHNVRELYCEYFDESEEIIGSNCLNYPTIMLPNLKILRLFELPELRSIYRGKMACPSLELIQIGECDKLERLPFCIEKEGSKQKQTIMLRFWDGTDEYAVSRRWWDSLRWDNPNAKSMYQPLFDTQSEYESKHEGEL